MNDQQRLDSHRQTLIPAPKLSYNRYELHHRLAAIDKELEFLERLSGLDSTKVTLRRMRAFLLGAHVVDELMKNSKSLVQKEKKDGTRP